MVFRKAKWRFQVFLCAWCVQMGVVDGDRVASESCVLVMNDITAKDSANLGES